MDQKWITCILYAFTFASKTNYSVAENGICGSISVLTSHDANSLMHRKNCRVIEGSIAISDIDISKLGVNYDDVAFPSLIEITDYLWIYNVKGVTSLGHLFPNLQIIRGNNLFFGKALRIHRAQNLTEIGLKSLTTIIQGVVEITSNPLLCFVDTINWQYIAKGTRKEDLYIEGNKPSNECPLCPSGKKGETDDDSHFGCPTSLEDPNRNYCWNRQYCQKICPSSCGHRACDYNGNCCDDKCLTSCEPTDPSACAICGAITLNNQCVEKCPENLYEHEGYCVSSTECRKPKQTKEYPLMPTTNFVTAFIPFNGTCIQNCPQHYMSHGPIAERVCILCNDTCKKKCDGGIVDSILAVQNFRGCEIITGTLVIINLGCNLVDDIFKELYQSLSEIEEIEGGLWIINLDVLTSLKFFKKLKIVRGFNMSYALYVDDNFELQSLFGHNVIFEHGKLYFHDNPKLCYSKIEELKSHVNDLRNLKQIDIDDVSPFTNGGSILCSLPLSAKISNLTATEASIEIEQTTGSQVSSLRLLFMETRHQNVTSEDHHSCFSSFYQVESELYSASLPGETINIHLQYLKPSTQYAFHVEEFIKFSLDSSNEEFSSEFPLFRVGTPVKYFITLPSNSEPKATMESMESMYIRGINDTINISPSIPLQASEGNCSRYEWKCNNGVQCILSDHFCDGIADCTDFSDETALTCTKNRCPKNAFNFHIKPEQTIMVHDDDMTAVENLNFKGTCEEDDLMCTSSGECIYENKICDGKIDCEDQSDETVERCATHYCPSYGFRCSYGGCIDESNRCDGMNDCADESDEHPELCDSTNISAKVVRQIIVHPSAVEGSCLIPHDLPGTIRVFYEADRDYEIFKGSLVAHSSAVIYRCTPKYSLDGNTTNVCLNGGWTTSNHPKCRKFCSPLPLAGFSIKVSCKIYDEKVSCHHSLRPETEARISCSFGYRKPVNRIVSEVLRCNEQGEWDIQPFKCEQICGLEAPVKNMPSWHVGILSNIYDKLFFWQICGGTILSARVVISAAHCFWDKQRDQFYDPSNFRVEAGTSYGGVYITNATKSQTLNVSKFIYKQKYEDSARHFALDIVFLILVDYIEFQPNIRPVCVNTNFDFRERYVESGFIRRTVSVTRRDEMIDLIVMEHNECKQKLSAELIPFLTRDKFCALFINGDRSFEYSGSGLVSSTRFGQSNVYFLKGIVGTVVTNDGSFSEDISNIFFATNVQHHIDMLRFILNKQSDSNYFCSLMRGDQDYFENNITKTTETSVNNFVSITSRLTINASAPVEGSCFVPLDLPATIRVYYEANQDKEIQRGSYVDPYIPIIYKCDNNFSLDEPVINFCLDGKWTPSNHPKCSKLCSILPFGIAIKTTCELKGEQVSCSDQLEVTTKVGIDCVYGYRLVPEANVTKVLRCTEEGGWSDHNFKCEQICGAVESGQPNPEISSRIIGGENANIFEVPWHVGIYSNIVNKDYFDQICGGTILNAKVVISAAHCFWDSQEGRFYDSSNFKVIAGKYMRDFNFNEPDAQTLDVDKIITRQEYKDFVGYYSVDFALLVLDNHIVFAPHVKPICLDSDTSFNETKIEPGSFGRVAGWGFESSGDKSSPTLKTIDLSVIDYSECERLSPIDFRPFMVSDKFCAGYNNKSRVWRGDSGAGLIFTKNIGNEIVNFLWGIVGNTRDYSGSYDNIVYSLFTNVREHIKMISKVEKENRPN